MPYSGLDEREVEHTSVHVYITGNPDIVLSVGRYYSVNIFDGTDQESLLHFSWFHDAELLTGPQFGIRLVMDLVTISLSVSANSSEAPCICTILTC